MLIQFNVTNYKSIAEQQTFSLVATKKDELTQNSFSLEPHNKMSLLRSAAIYGANASGKSNLLDALYSMKNIVVKSAVNHQRGDKLPVVPFMLDSQTRNQPTEFEVVFVQNNIRYQYGFSTTKERIIEEWLIAFPKGRAQRWFNREWNEKDEQYTWEMGNSLQGEKQLWQKATRGNALFLSTAIHLNSETLQPIFDWFKYKLQLANVSGWFLDFSAELCMDDGKEQVLEFLQAADLDIHDVKIHKEKFDSKSLPNEMPDPIKEVITKSMDGKDTYDIKTVHKTHEGELVSFKLSDESDGTSKLFGLAGPWIDALKTGKIVFFDELHDNLHPKLVQFLVQLFHNEKINLNNAQLVFTTHETSILNQEIFRRDQIWFCEKDDKHSTQVYPLTDFSPRKHHENLEVSYLAGRYGALPYVKKVVSL